MTLLIFVLLTLLSIALVVYIIFWFVHVSTSKADNYAYGYATFGKFLKYYEEYQDVCKVERGIYNKIVSYGSVDIRYDRITFNQKRMIMGFLNYWKFLIWFYSQFTQDNKKKQKSLKVKW